ncbi:hypothetical protein O9929_17460 [Vibrio lentus]|nr:hypothetical protein [Vibrio lentus]
MSKTSSYTFHNGQLSRFELNLGQHGIVIPALVRDDELEVLINRNSGLRSLPSIPRRREIR